MRRLFSFWRSAPQKSGMMVSKAFLKELHQSNTKAFLFQLYSLSPEASGKKNRDKCIQSATKLQCKVLLTVLHLIMCKVIPIRTSQVERLQSARKLPLIAKTLKAKSDFRDILKASAEEQKDFLRRINCYHQLLFNMFNSKVKEA